ncbi:hypothetical protein ACIPRI_23645 [Variovorax sp. LARHSF232]
MATYPFAPRTNPDGTPRPETDEEYRERVIACLEHLDPMDRNERAERHVWLGKHHVQVGAYWERSETTGVMQEARSSYVQGNFIATLVLALAYVEHVINDALPPLPPDKWAPKMATAIKQARDAGLFTEDLLDGAAVLNDFRNPFMHRRDENDPDTIGQRVRSRKSHPRTILEHDARDALQVMYGFFRHSFDPPLAP